MDQSTLVGAQLDEGRRLVERFAADGHPIVAAFWVNTSEDDNWFLYLATSIVDRLGPAAAYNAVHASLRALDQPKIRSSEIKVVSPNSPIVRDVLNAMQRMPDRQVTRFGSRMLGSIPVDQLYVYSAQYFAPSQLPAMTSDDVGRVITRLLNSGAGAVQSARVMLKDGTAFTGVPFAIYRGSQYSAVAQFIADGDVTPRVVRLDEIASIA